jgi:uncharacterized membrane protein YebE (DUF533 family)
MSKTTKIILIVSVLAVITLIAYFVYKNKKGSEKEVAGDKGKTATTPAAAPSSKASKIVNMAGDVLGTVADSGVI